MRVVVVGISGAGKSTLAHRIACRFAVPHVELDALQWEAGWRSVQDTDPAEFIRRVQVATAGPDWVVDGNYSLVRHLTWDRATHLVWLDYERSVVMARVIRRSVLRAVQQTELWAGNREDWRQWHHASHPIRWAWSQWRGRRVRTEQYLAEPRSAHLKVLRVRRTREVRGVMDWLDRTCGQSSA